MTQIVSAADLGIDFSRGGAEPKLPGACRFGAISIGNFDGVHRGHAILLSRLRLLADRLGGPAVAVTFDPHPAKILRPVQTPPRITSIATRAERMSLLGVDFLVVCHTTRKLLNLSAAEFFQQLVREQLGAVGIVEGPNFFFGKDRGGDTETLRKMASQTSRPVEVEIVPRQSDGDQMVSSSLIRSHIATGDIGNANRLCGHRHRLCGVVSPGSARGRTLGFPTANLQQIDVLVPGQGVYGGTAWTSTSGRFPAAIHIGPNPTFSDQRAVKVEVHLIGYDGDLYGQHLQVDFDHRVRDIQAFGSAEQLRQQLEVDIQYVRNHLPDPAS